MQDNPLPLIVVLSVAMFPIAFICYTLYAAGVWIGLWLGLFTIDPSKGVKFDKSELKRRGQISLAIVITILALIVVALYLVSR